jgi:hypothetical protein
MRTPFLLALTGANQKPASGDPTRRGQQLFRKVLGWSLVVIVAMCALVYLEWTPVLDWMVVK